MDFIIVIQFIILYVIMIKHLLNYLSNINLYLKIFNITINLLRNYIIFNTQFDYFLYLF